MFEYLSEKDKKVYLLIRNRLVHGLDGPKLREINDLIKKTSPRSAVLALDRLEAAGLITRESCNKIRLTNELLKENISPSTINVPLVGSIAAGIPILANENIEATIPVATSIAKSGSKYFLLRIIGDSMNEAIVGDIKMEEGSFVLVRQQATANNGDIVVALIDDSATVKFFEKKGNIIILKPKSNKKFTPIVLGENLIIQGIVTAVFPKEILLFNL